MGRCILHVGMQKTGSSSIQETLFFGLRDRSYRYFSAGEINGSRMLYTLTSGDSLAEFYWGRSTKGASFARVWKAYYQRKLRRAMDRARGEGSTLILSGEDMWGQQEEGMVNLRGLLQDYGFETTVMVYIRPWKSFLESNYQQRLKGMTRRMNAQPRIGGIGIRDPNRLSYRGKLEMLDRVFGRDRVIAKKFAPSIFPDGCVVQDFMSTVGIPMEASKIRRANESMSMEASKLLYAYRMFGPVERGWGEFKVWMHYWMVLSLQEIEGERLKFHSRLVLPILEEKSQQARWIEERIGASIDEDMYKDDDRECIGELSDFYRFKESTLQWLANRVGGRMPSEMEGEEAARQVALLMDRLRHQVPSGSKVIGSIGRFSERCWRRWRSGDR